MKEIVVDAKIEEFDKVLDFINENLDSIECPVKAKRQIDISVEEIFVNIAHYAYGSETGQARISFENVDDPKSVRITFVDRGVPYDPLAKDDPDVSLSIEEREVGGLGIFMAKNLMDEMRYEFKDGCNVLVLTKNM